MSLEHVHTVLLAGGVGSRFWPLSRRARPKQLLDLFGRGSLLRMTFERLLPLVPPERQLVVTGSVLGAAVRADLPEVPAANVLEEPCGRNTAPAIGWAAAVALARDPDAVLAVVPSDQHIADEERYRADVRTALDLAREGFLATLGIPPTRPETGYGYIQAGPSPHEVLAFVEKPDLETALRYLASGDFLWNAGMFFARADVVLDELDRFEPALGAAVRGLGDRAAEVYPTLRSISFDYAVMERTALARVVRSDCGWSDVGSWQSLFDFRDGPSLARGDVVEIDGEGNVLVAEGGLVACVGVRDLVVVHTKDATLVCPREASQRLREVVQELERRQREDLL